MKFIYNINLQAEARKVKAKTKADKKSSKEKKEEVVVEGEQ